MSLFLRSVDSLRSSLSVWILLATFYLLLENRHHDLETRWACSLAARMGWLLCLLPRTRTLPELWVVVVLLSYGAVVLAERRSASMLRLTPIAAWLYTGLALQLPLSIAPAACCGLFGLCAAELQKLQLSCVLGRRLELADPCRSDFVRRGGGVCPAAHDSCWHGPCTHESFAGCPLQARRCPVRTRHTAPCLGNVDGHGDSGCFIRRAPGCVTLASADGMLARFPVCRTWIPLLPLLCCCCSGLLQRLGLGTPCCYCCACA